MTSVMVKIKRNTLLCEFLIYRVTGGELFEDIVAREFYSEADARLVARLIMASDR